MRSGRIKKLTINNEVYETTNYIHQKLAETIHSWILECELENVILEIKDDVLYFKGGIFYWGYWKWGVFDGGEFRSGIWDGGILRNGIFKGEYKRMVHKGGEMKGKKIK